MTDWKALISAQGLDISQEELERILPLVDALRNALDWIVPAIPFEVEPATIFRCEPEGELTDEA